MKLFDYLCEDLGLIQTIGTIVILIIIGLLYIIQISKIEVNPYTCIARFIRRVVGTKQLCAKIDTMEMEFANYRFEIYRSNILIFSRGLKDGESYTEVEWRVIFENITKYRVLTKKYGFSDELVDIEVAYLKKCFQNVDSG